MTRDALRFVFAPVALLALLTFGVGMTREAAAPLLDAAAWIGVGAMFARAWVRG